MCNSRLQKQFRHRTGKAYPEDGLLSVQSHSSLKVPLNPMKKMLHSKGCMVKITQGSYKVSTSKILKQTSKKPQQSFHCRASCISAKASEVATLNSCETNGPSDSHRPAAGTQQEVNGVGATELGFPAHKVTGLETRPHHQVWSPSSNLGSSLPGVKIKP